MSERTYSQSNKADRGKIILCSTFYHLPPRTTFRNSLSVPRGGLFWTDTQSLPFTEQTKSRVQLADRGLWLNAPWHLLIFMTDEPNVASIMLTPELWVTHDTKTLHFLFSGKYICKSNRKDWFALYVLCNIFYMSIFLKKCWNASIISS